MFRGKILLIDRFSSMNTLINSYLSASGFVVDCMRSINELDRIKLDTIHLALLDIDTAGNKLKETIGRMKDAGVPVIVLTSESDYAGRLSALELGAADVMSRPLDIAELVARIRAAQARTQVSITGFDRPPVSFGGLSVDISKYHAELDGEPLSISPKETALLYLLISSPDTVFSRVELSRQLRSSGNSSERTVNVFISRLKKAIGRYGANIVPVRGVGYKFISNSG